jgi:hypothetical protein
MYALLPLKLKCYEWSSMWVLPEFAMMFASHLFVLQPITHNSVERFKIRQPISIFNNPFIFQVGYVQSSNRLHVSWQNILHAVCTFNVPVWVSSIGLVRYGVKRGVAPVENVPGKAFGRVNAQNVVRYDGNPLSGLVMVFREGRFPSAFSQLTHFSG